ncbi:MAG: virulence protein RhuM/Fic/DOC family protein [Lachnospiraceae bacterium]|nr:virulence protein RhuM/Fic/DOC family protein [Lachnospiraceae bacterium]
MKSRRGVEFRRWANAVLKQYILKGYAVNHNRMKQLGEVIRLMKRTENALDSRQVLSVIEKYNTALDLLDAYDHQNMKRPKGTETVYHLTYEECRDVIAQMRFGNESELFGKEKDDSFRGSIGNIYQSFGGQDVYESLEEKAANLLYFVTKNHSFFDGNKRIAATMFLYFLDKNGVLFVDGRKLIEDYTLVALTIMIAESRPEEKEMMVSVVMNCLK